jgi:hypothetical protein
VTPSATRASGIAATSRSVSTLNTALGVPAVPVGGEDEGLDDLGSVAADGLCGLGRRPRRLVELDDVDVKTELREPLLRLRRGRMHGRSLLAGERALR